MNTISELSAWHREVQQAQAEIEWIAKDQAIRDIILLMRRYNISIEEIVSTSSSKEMAV